MENVKGHLPLHNSVSGIRVKVPLYRMISLSQLYRAKRNNIR